MSAVSAELAGIVVLILLNGFFAASEIAVIALRRGRLRQLAEAGDRRALAVQRLHAAPDRFFATVQIGVTVVSTLASALGGASAAHVLEPLLARARAPFVRDHAEALALALAVAPIAFLSLVLGELVPKSLALRHAEGLALRVARPIALLGRAAAPLVWLLTRTSNLLLRPFGDATSFAEARLTVDEIRAVVEEGGEAGTVPPRVGEICDRAFDLGTLRVADVLVPRGDVVTLDVAATDAEVRALLGRQPHARIPVVRGSLDDAVGYVALKDLVADLAAGRAPDLAARVRRPLYVPVALGLDALVDRLRAEREALAFAVDEFGGVAGIVTMADVVAEIVGGLTGASPRSDSLVEVVAGGAVVAAGEAAVRAVERALGADLPHTSAATTIGGLVTAVAGRIPPAGAALTVGWAQVHVLESDARQVRRVRIEPPEARPATPAAAGPADGASRP